MFSAVHVSILVLALPLSVLASHFGQSPNRRHSDLSRRSEANISLYHRAPGARWSYYDTQTGSAGSCGTYLSNSGFTVALNAAQMNPSYCFKQITMTYNGKSTTAVIADTCPGCPYNGLDLSPGLFAFFAPQSVGIIYGDWELGGAPPPYTPPPPPPTPAYTPPPPPPTTSAWVAPKPTSTSTWSPPPSSSSSVAASSSVKHSSSSAFVPAATQPPSVNNLQGINQAFIQLGGLIISGNQLSIS